MPSLSLCLLTAVLASCPVAPEPPPLASQLAAMISDRETIDAHGEFSDDVGAQEGSDQTSEEALITDRPDATESPNAVAPGRIQLESGYTFSTVEREDSHSLGELLLRIGVLPDLELRAGLNSFEVRRGPGGNAEGFSDTSLGLKWQLADGGGVGSAAPALGLLVGASLPTGAAELSDDTVQPSALLAAGWDLSDRVSLSSNVGWAYLDDPELRERFSELVASVALGYALSERWGAYAEYFGAYGLDGRDDESFVNSGLTYLLSSDLQLDGRIGYGLNGRDDDFFIGIGTAVRW